MAPHGPDSGASEAALLWGVADGADRLGGGLDASSSASSERSRRLTRPWSLYLGEPRSNPMEEAALHKKGVGDVGPVHAALGPASARFTKRWSLITKQSHHQRTTPPTNGCTLISGSPTRL